MYIGTSGTNGCVPVGTIIAYAGLNPAQFEINYWFLCDGRSCSSTALEWANLFRAIGGQYGSNGASFNLPNLSGNFLRGVGDVSTDPDFATRYQQGKPGVPLLPGSDPVGSFQDDSLKKHTHSLPNAFADGGGFVFNSHGGWNWHYADQTGEAGDSTETRPKNAYVYFLIYAGPPLASTKEVSSDD